MSIYTTLTLSRKRALELLTGDINNTDLGNMLDNHPCIRRNLNNVIVVDEDDQPDDNKI